MWKSISIVRVIQKEKASHLNRQLEQKENTLISVEYELTQSSCCSDRKWNTDMGERKTNSC